MTSTAWTDAPDERKRTGIVLSAAVLLVALLVSLVFWVLTRQYVEHQLQNRLTLQAGTFAAEVQERAEDVVGRLGSIGALFDASSLVTESEFGVFTSEVASTPEVLSVDYAPAVRADDLTAFEQRARDLVPGFTLRSEGEAGSVLYPVLYSTPGEAGLQLRGADLASSSPYGSIVDRATQTGEVAYGPLPPSWDGLRGFSVVIPRYDSSGSPQGLIAAAVDLNATVDEAVSPDLRRVVQWSVTDAPEEQPSGLVHIEPISMGGKTWWFAISPTAASDLSTRQWQPDAVLVLGILFSVLLALMMLSAWRRGQATRNVEVLRDLNRAKDDFLSSVGHEVRTPLTAVVGFLGELHDNWDGLGDEERREFAGVAAEQADEVASVVADLLVAARADIGSMRVQTSKVSMRGELQRALAGLPSREAASVRLPTGDGVAWADARRVRHILRNLLSNAIQHGGAGVSVEIESASDGEHVRVMDDGPGLPPGRWETAFEPYAAAPAQTVRPIGVGLFVARRLARLMDGELSYVRRGDLTVFDLRLPSPPPEEPATEGGAATVGEAARSLA